MTARIPCAGPWHQWPPDAADGDTCNCGAWYRFPHAIESTEAKPQSAPDKCAHTDTYVEGYPGELRGATRMVRDCTLDAGHSGDHVYGQWVKL